MSVDFRTEITHYSAVFALSVATPASDLEEIADLVNRAYAKAVFVKQRITVEELRQIVTDPLQKLYLCHSPQGTICGTLQLESLQENKASLALFAVDSWYKGIGKVFLDRIEQELFKKVQVVALNVITFQQGRLIDFYKRSGYVASGVPTELNLADDIRDGYLKPAYRGQILEVLPMHKCRQLGTPV